LRCCQKGEDLVFSLAAKQLHRPRLAFTGLIVIISTNNDKQENLVMKQAIAGVSPPEQDEITIMVVWPSVAFRGLGRLLGRLYSIRFPDIYIFRLGNLIALLSIPLALKLYFSRIAPFIGRRYTLTNRRVVVQTGLTGSMIEGATSIPLDSFDDIRVKRRPGDLWYDAGDLEFYHGDTMVGRLVGVSRPDSFRATCLKAHSGFVGVQAALG
tara:strand:+ start:195 stop:827 length:633 start_codon:yes stop_codon:yes gene_type:complete